MRIVTRWLVTLVLVLPAPALAQAPAKADLVGTWVRTAPWQTNGKQGTEVDTLAFRDDGRWRIRAVGYPYFDNTIGRQWSVAGDTLWLNPPAAPQAIPGGRTVAVGALPNKVTLKGEELTIVMPMEKGQKETYVYQRVSATPSWPKESP